MMMMMVMMILQKHFESLRYSHLTTISNGIPEVIRINFLTLNRTKSIIINRFSQLNIRTT